MSQLLHPKLTTIKQDTEEIGRKAAKRLIGSIENQNNSLRESRYRRNPHTGTIGRKDSGTKNNNVNKAEAKKLRRRVFYEKRKSLAHYYVYPW